MDMYKVPPDERIYLRQWDPNDKGIFPGGKSNGKKRVVELNRELEELQELLYAESKNKVLIILQGMDTAGKDGTIRHVFDGVNPQGVRVACFKVPTRVELDHDYLWRIHNRTPGNGEIVIFNRSHYEDVLVVRVHSLVSEDVWQKRFEHINCFEKILTDEGTTILKFFLWIDLDEQKQRLQARLDNPHKQWKFKTDDLKERKRWDEYIQAYEDILSKTSTEWAPWYIIPANRKWYRNLVIGEILIQKLKDMKMSYPKPEEDLSGVVVE